MIVHIMKDGTVKDSVKGVVIQEKQFYIVYNEILKKVGAKQCHS